MIKTVRLSGVFTLAVLLLSDPAYGQTRTDGCSQALNDEFIEPPIVDLDLLEIVAEHRDPDLPDPELIKKQWEYADAGPARSRCRGLCFR